MKCRPSPELGARNKNKIFLDTIFQNKLEFGKFGTLQLDLCGVSYIYVDTGLQASWSMEDSYPPPLIISDLVLDIQKVTLYEMNEIMIELRSSSHEAPSPSRRVLLTNIEECSPFPCSQLGASFCRGLHIPQGVFLLNPPCHQLFFLHSHCPEEFVV